MESTKYHRLISDYGCVAWYIVDIAATNWLMERFIVPAAVLIHSQ
jgi:hypothetical protein